MKKETKEPVTIYLTGKAGVGKYTIAKQLAEHNFKILDNHLINNPIFSLLDLDRASPIPQDAWVAVSRIRWVVSTICAITV